MKKTPNEVSTEVENLYSEYFDLVISIEEEGSISRLIALGQDIDKLKKLAPEPYNLDLLNLIADFQDLFQRYSKESPQKVKAEKSEEKVITPKVTIQSSFRNFLKKWKDSLKDAKLVRDYTNCYIPEGVNTRIDNIKAIAAIIQHIEDDKDFELGFSKDPENIDKIRYQKGEIDADLAYSFEIHREIDKNGQEKFVSYVLLKTKGSFFRANGSSRIVKDCLRYDDEWAIWVNGTHLVKLKESEITQAINSKHVQVQVDGARYTSASQKPRSKDKQKYSTYSKKANHDLTYLPENISFANLYSICLTSALGLAATHKAGYIHRDVKFENILIYHEVDDEKNEFCYAKVADFGLATKTSEATQHGVKGTPYWMTPGKLLVNFTSNYLFNKTEFAIQAELISKANNSEISKIEPDPIASPKDDIFALAKAFYIKFDQFLLDNKGCMSPAIEKEAGYLKKYFSNIMATPPKEQPTSEEIVDHLQKRLYEFSDQNPGKEWEKIKRHCDMPTQTPKIEQNISIINESKLHQTEISEFKESVDNTLSGAGFFTNWGERFTERVCGYQESKKLATEWVTQIPSAPAIKTGSDLSYSRH